MRNVAQVLGRQPRKKLVFDKIAWPNNDQLIGLEIEVDSVGNKRVKFPDLDYSTAWRKTNDGSLRNGYEYVLRNPLAGDALSEAIHEFFVSEPVIHRTSTGSTHIHIDMMEENTP